MKFKPAKFHEKNGDLNQRWCVDYYFEHPETNKLERQIIWISSKIKTRGERRRKGDELKAEINRKLQAGWNPYENNLQIIKTLRLAFDHLLELKKFNARKRTRTDYKCVFKYFIIYLENIGKSNITAGDVNYIIALNYFEWIQKERNLSNYTLNNHLIYLKAAFNILIKREYCAFNPFLNIKKFEIEDSGILAFSEAETKLISETLPMYNRQLYIISLLIYYCYIRPQEICRLRIYNIDLKHKEIIIFANQSKNKKQESVGIPEVLFEELLNSNLDKYPSDYLFCSKGFLPGEIEIAPTRIAEAWRIYADSVGLPKTKHMYHLKHTSNGRAVDMGLSLRDLQLQNRHSTLAMTDKYVRRFRTSVSKEFLNKMPGL
jgi:integrase/recombinase XerD